MAGAPHDLIEADQQRGSIYTFARTGPAVRNQTAKLTVPAGQAIDLFGTSVAIDGDVIAAGASGEPLGTAEGAVYLFTTAGADDRDPTARLAALAPDNGAAPGTSVAIDDDVIVSGAPQTDVTVAAAKEPSSRSIGQDRRPGPRQQS